MEKQKVEYIPISELVLWSENPRDPIYEDNNDQKIVDRALGENNKIWALDKLAKNMGDIFDHSELPIVVYHNRIPIVYDGNRRIILAKIKHNLVTITEEKRFLIPDFPYSIPCNVCTQDVALKHIWRKHGDSGSWNPLERDIFLHRHMGYKKSDYLIIEEATGLIGSNPAMNKGFVKNEIFRAENIKKLGFSTDSGELKSKYDAKTANIILLDLAKKIEATEISTRKNRGDVLGVLEGSTRKIIEDNKTGKANKKCAVISENHGGQLIKNRKRSPRSNSKNKIFGGPLYLKSCEVNNIYRDISDLYDYYNNNQHVLSSTFISVIRMSLRLLCEVAAKDKGFAKLDNYIN
ncbi:hypothetical protein, partial [Sedimenticola hydrogenitrophicus]|uniref:hypothetical protein n=1 Tax=Sedimenticola hydrogenitrophicus TaxID=2967975 RepID=UPI0023AEEDFE